MQGYYHSKLSFGTVDGPGIRFVLFLTGCQLGCSFCHNPDTWARGEQLITVAEVLREVEEYRQFYEASGGGITVSGGEPLLQPAFTAELFRQCQSAGIHTALDTCGFVPKENILQVLPYADRVLFSLKGSTDAAYQQLTKARSMKLILENLQLIAERKPVTVRYVFIPDYTDGPECLAALIRIMNGLPATAEVEILPYHTLGRGKWKELGWEYLLDGVPEPAPEQLQAFRQQLQQAGIRLAATEQ